MTRKFPEISTPSPSSLSVVAAALNPRFRHLNFLDSDKAEAVKEEVLDRVEEQFGTTATTNLLEPPAKRAAPTGSLSRLFKSRATDPGEPAGKYPARLDREVEVYFEEAEVDIEEDPLPGGRLTKLGFPMWPHLLGEYSACQEHLFHQSVCSPQLAFSSRSSGVLCRLSTLTLPSSLVATRCCQAPGSARRLLQEPPRALTLWRLTTLRSRKKSSLCRLCLSFSRIPLTRKKNTELDGVAALCRMHFHMLWFAALLHNLLLLQLACTNIIS